jgi:tetratricopeptide (TPR) repeat protein
VKLTKYVYVVLLLTALSAVANGQNGACGEKDYECKIAAATRTIDSDPKNEEPYYDRGVAYKNNGQYDLAIADYTKYIAMKPKNPVYLADGFVGRANVYRITGKHDLAIADYGRALQIDPKNHNALLNRGITFWNKKDYASALKDYDALLAMNAKDPEAYYHRGLVFMDQGKNALAIAEFDKYVVLDVSNNEYIADGFLNRGIVRFRNGDLAGSLADYTKSIGLNPNQAKTYEARAATYRKMGKADLAAADEQKAQELKQ